MISAGVGCAAIWAVGSGAFAPGPRTTEPKYYLGVAGLYRSRYEVFYPSAANVAVIGPWQVLVGTRLTPRFSLQAGYSYHRQRDTQDPYITGTTAAGDFVSGARYSAAAVHALPLLARYSWPRESASRVRLQALLGATLLHSWNELREVERVNEQPVNEFYRSEQGWQAYATAGFGAGYQFGRRVEIMADLVWNKNLHAAPASVHLEATGNRWGLTSVLGLSLRYCFDVGPAAPGR